MDRIGRSKPKQLTQIGDSETFFHFFFYRDQNFITYVYFYKRMLHL